MAVRITQSHPNLVGWYKLDDNLATTQVLDASGNGNHGTATANTNTLSASGPFGDNSALNIVPAAITVPHNAAFNLGTISLSGWCKPASSGTLVGKYVYAVGGGFALKMNAANVINFHYYLILPDYLDELSVTVSSSLLGKWSHIVAIRTTSTISIYWNGVFQNSVATTTAATQTGTSPMYFGAWRSSSDARWLGLLSDVRIYSTALSANEIYSQYIAGIRRRC